MSPEMPLYTPPSPESSRTFQFLNHVNAKYGLHLSSYEHLFKWSTDRIDDFWSTVWDQVEIIGTKGNHIIDLPATPADNPLWFSEAQLNWAENMLHVRSDKNALVQASMLLSWPFG
jgi:acetoacetyl-CoA synthetase